MPATTFFGVRRKRSHVCSTALRRMNVFSFASLTDRLVVQIISFGFCLGCTFIVHQIMYAALLIYFEGLFVTGFSSSLFVYECAGACAGSFVFHFPKKRCTLFSKCFFSFVSANSLATVYQQLFFYFHILSISHLYFCSHSTSPTIAYALFPPPPSTTATKRIIIKNNLHLSVFSTLFICCLFVCFFSCLFFYSKRMVFYLFICWLRFLSIVILPCHYFNFCFLFVFI